MFWMILFYGETVSQMMRSGSTSKSLTGCFDPCKPAEHLQFTDCSNDTGLLSVEEGYTCVDGNSKKSQHAEEASVLPDVTDVWRWKHTK